MRAVILGCAGAELNAEERRFFRDADPLGFILFARNCRDPDQIRALVAELRACVGRADAPVLIDQEGGRVARLGPPHWRKPPAARIFADLAQRDGNRAVAAARLNARLIADDLAALGITIDCTPVLDVPAPGAHDIIGDRAYGLEPKGVAELGRAVCEGMLAGGVLPVIKHVPGHGRAGVDSHLDLPVVDATRAELEAIDFAPFQALADMPWAMTAHVVYRALDPLHCATVSARVVSEVIRGHIGFDGVLVSDDLSMKALKGDLGERAEAARAAGCDLLLHCNGERAEMEAVMAATPILADAALRRVVAAEARRVAGMDRGFDVARALVGLKDMLA